MYVVSIFIYRFSIFIISPFHLKAKQFSEGRKNIFQKIKNQMQPNEKRIWFHCASIGEFEQARPVIEKLKKQVPQFKIVLTFFSPSGYELRKNYSQADYVFYLPMDTRKNAEQFVQLIDPILAVFVKYEFWKHYLETLKNRKVKSVLISGIFRPQQFFFRWYGKSFLSILKNFDSLLVQNESSKILLNRFLIQNVFVCNDTRFDRVIENANEKKTFPLIENFIGNKKVFVAGSIWPADLKLLLPIMANCDLMEWIFILVPHEISTSFINEIKSAIQERIILESELNKISEGRILVIDSVGKLSSLYAYAHCSYVGGGFGKGIHNVLEPAVFGIPIFIGPKHTKFNEANQLLKLNATFRVNSAEDLANQLKSICATTDLKTLGNVNRNYVFNNAGGSEFTCQFLIQKLLN